MRRHRGRRWGGRGVPPRKPAAPFYGHRTIDVSGLRMRPNALGGRLRCRSNVLYDAPSGRIANVPMRHPSSRQPESDYGAQIARARQGIGVAEAAGIMQRWSIPVGAFAALLGVSERKWSRARAGRPDGLLSPVQSDRLLRVSQVLDHASAVFDDDQDAVAWFSMTNHALSGETPLSLMDTDAGVRQVDDVLTRVEFGVFA